jgi:hypothetical protein
MNWPARFVGLVVNCFLFAASPEGIKVKKCGLAVVRPLPILIGC